MRLFGGSAAIASRLALSQVWGLTPFSFAVSISEAIRPHAAAPSS